MSHHRLYHRSHHYRRSPSPIYRREHHSRSRRSRSPGTNSTYCRHSRRRRHHRPSPRHHVRSGYRRFPSPRSGHPKDRHDSKRVTAHRRRRSPQYHHFTPSPRDHTSRHIHHRHHYHRRRRTSRRPKSVSPEPRLKMRSPSVSPSIRKSSYSPPARYLPSLVEPYHIIPSQPLHISVTLSAYNGTRSPGYPRVPSPSVGRGNTMSLDTTPVRIPGKRRKVPMVPMTKAEHDRRQAVVREERDPLTGRIR
ncbi:hypothetical protein IWQ61_001260 [Dispira simplex]|nr:hypothetical protein IWQ61_001260 [Dispira simplex]